MFLAANPLGLDPPALDFEARAIQIELERCAHRDQFEFVTRWAVQPPDLLRELRRVKPTIKAGIDVRACRAYLKAHATGLVGAFEDAVARAAAEE